MIGPSNKIFIDTEFIEDGETIKPISIGLVKETGEEYYAEFSDTDLNEANEFVKISVIPNLKHPVSKINGTFPLLQWSPLFKNSIAKNTYQIRGEILEFVGYSPVFIGYYADYDWVLMCQLFGNMADLPSDWPMLCLDLKQELIMNEINLDTPEEKFPQPTTHNALDDAKWVKEVWMYLNS